MRRPAYVVPRRVLDARLVDAAVAAGAVLQRHTVHRLQARPDRVVVDGAVHARALVGADGAGSVVRRHLGLPAGPPGHVAIALRGYAPTLPPLRGAQVIVFGPGAGLTYAWSFPVGDGTANVGYGTVLRGAPVTRRSLAGGLAELLPGAARGGTGWRGHHLPLASRTPRQPDGRVLLAGDALSLVNPLTGEGIFYAVVSGASAGVAAVTAGADADAGRAHRRALRGRLGRHLRHVGVAARLAAVPRVLAGTSAAAGRDRRVFDDLVELGLGEGTVTPAVLRAGAGALLAR